MQKILRSVVVLMALWPWVVAASVPNQIAPRGGFIPLNRQAVAAHGKVPSQREATFMPLPPRNVARPLRTETAEAADMREAPKVSAAPRSISEDDAKLLLSIFAPAD